jgi:hypothetical protein
MAAGFGSQWQLLWLGIRRLWRFVAQRLCTRNGFFLWRIFDTLFLPCLLLSVWLLLSSRTARRLGTRFLIEWGYVKLVARRHCSTLANGGLQIAHIADNRFLEVY